jgi:quinohemoprotein amine dehydrogenase
VSVIKRMPAVLAGVVVLTATLLYAQEGGAPSRPATAETKEEGIPVTDPLVLSKCGTCHKKDDHGNLSRISWERATPEGWEEAVKRMVRLNGLTLTPAEARSILKYLSTDHGLAPEEAKPVMYMAEHRIQDETIDNETVRGTCTACHAFGRALAWRRTKDDWKLLANLHVALYAQADQTFRAGCGANSGCRGSLPEARNRPGPPQPLPVDEVIDYMGKNYGLHSPEWAAWRARMRSPKLAGRWLISAHVIGHGDFFGEMTISPGSADDEFATHVTLQSVKDGSKVERSGSGLVYAGYSWRGRSKGTAMPANPVPDDLSHEMREAMWISPDQSYAEGRWFWGEYQEFGIDVKMQRASANPALLSLDRTALKTGSQGLHVRLWGDNFPADVTAADLDFGSGVTVKSVVSHTPREIVASVDVATSAVPGKRDVAFRRSVLQNATAVYDRVDYLKVVPESTLARLGSDVHPKGYQQFEAIGYQRGADGKLHTADDVELGVIDSTFSVEEFLSVYGDDDKEFVGSLSANGFFTPSSDGPNPQRKFSRNNYGDIWVVATAKNEMDKDGKPLVGKSYLVVTVPSYIHWDQPEVAP